MKYFVVIALFLSSCVGQLGAPEKPKDLIPADKMAETMKDLMILEGYMNVSYESVNRFHKVMTKSGEALLKSKHITVKQYESSFAYYFGNEELMQPILDRAMDEMNKEILILEKEEQDSLKKTNPSGNSIQPPTSTPGTPALPNNPR